MPRSRGALGPFPMPLTSSTTKFTDTLLFISTNSDIKTMTPTDFLTLPLRDKIYGRCFYECIMVIPHSKFDVPSSPSLQARSLHRYSISLLRVCRQVYDESIPYSYAKDTFCLSLDVQETPRTGMQISLNNRKS